MYLWLFWGVGGIGMGFTTLKQVFYINMFFVAVLKFLI